MVLQARILEWVAIFFCRASSQTRDQTSLGQEDPLEKEKATHSSILAWKILWAKEPGGLQSMGLRESDTI